MVHLTQTSKSSAQITGNTLENVFVGSSIYPPELRHSSPRHQHGLLLIRITQHYKVAQAEWHRLHSEHSATTPLQREGSKSCC